MSHDVEQSAEQSSGRCSRRAALHLALVAPALVALAACNSEPEPPPGTLVELARLPEGERVVVMHEEEPVELVRTGNRVRARSLWCTHVGCRVRWVEATGVYSCLCHEGTFDAEGKPRSGPPPRPLRTVTLEVENGRVVLPLRPAQDRPLPAADGSSGTVG